MQHVYATPPWTRCLNELQPELQEAAWHWETHPTIITESAKPNSKPNSESSCHEGSQKKTLQTTNFQWSWFNESGQKHGPKSAKTPRAFWHFAYLWPLLACFPFLWEPVLFWFPCLQSHQKPTMVKPTKHLWALSKTWHMPKPLALRCAASDQVLTQLTPAQLHQVGTWPQAKRWWLVRRSSAWTQGLQCQRSRRGILSPCAPPMAGTPVSRTKPKRTIDSRAKWLVTGCSSREGVDLPPRRGWSSILAPSSQLQGWGHVLERNSLRL